MEAIPEASGLTAERKRNTTTAERKTAAAPICMEQRQLFIFQAVQDVLIPLKSKLRQQRVQVVCVRCKLLAGSSTFFGRCRVGFHNA